MSIAASGLKSTVEAIDNRTDFKTYMQNYAYAHGGQAFRGPKREGPWDEGYVGVKLNFLADPRLNFGLISQLPPLPSYGNTAEKVYTNAHANASSVSGATSNSNGAKPESSRATFGVDLAEQMMRDNVEIPPVMEKCCTAIEKYGLRSQGLYRISGTITKVLKLKEKLDKGTKNFLLYSHSADRQLLDVESVNLDADEWASDINNVSGVLKLWLRELPDPLLTQALHQGFIEAASCVISHPPRNCD